MNPQTRSRGLRKGEDAGSFCVALVGEVFVRTELNSAGVSAGVSVERKVSRVKVRVEGMLGYR